MELWNSLPDNQPSPSRPVSWTIPLSAENTSVLTESAAPSDLYFSALTVNLFTYFTKEATQTIHHFVQNCSRCIENYCFKHKNLIGCRGPSPPSPTGGSAHGGPGPPLGARPQTTIIGSRSHARDGCVWPPLFFTLRVPALKCSS